MPYLIANKQIQEETMADTADDPNEAEDVVVVPPLHQVLSIFAFVAYENCKIHLYFMAAKAIAGIDN